MRLFLGLPPSPTVRDTLFEWVCQTVPPDNARIVPKALYHVTLAFLGECNYQQLPALHTIVQSVAAAYPAPSLSTQDISIFGKGAKTILYAALSPSDLLTDLYAALCSRLLEHNQPYDAKPLIPHITLARKGAWPPLPTNPLPKLTFQPDQLILYHSTRQDGELQYLPLVTAPFSRL